MTRPSRLNLHRGFMTVFFVPALLVSAARAYACIPSGGESSIQAALSGRGSKAVLCKRAVFDLRNTIVFTHPDQEIYTEGFPAGDERATLRVASLDVVTAIYGWNASGVKIMNVIIDGQKPVYGWVNPSRKLPWPNERQALIVVGGVGVSGLIVHGVKAFEPRGWSVLYVGDDEGNCKDATITNNELRPGGAPYPREWSDGISLGCTHSMVSNNAIIDPTDGGIVIYGARGSRILNNTIRAVSVAAASGINLVDVCGNTCTDYTGVVVDGNVVDAASAPIKVAVPMGPPVYSLWCGESIAVRGASVTNNVLRGNYMGYGFVVDGVADWTVVGNVSHATHSGTPFKSCTGSTVNPPAPFIRNVSRTSGTFQAEFVNGIVENANYLAVDTRPAPPTSPSSPPPP